MSLVVDWSQALWQVLAQSGPYLLVGLLLAGLLEVLVPKGLIRRHLGGRGLGPVTRAALIGAPVPLCSCSVLPTATQLRRDGASPGATTSFLIATPETGVDSIGISYALLDPMMTIARPVTAIATAVGAGLAVDAAGAAPAPEAPASSCCEDHEHDHPPRGGRLQRAVSYAFGPLLADLTPWFVLGFALAAVIALAVPADFFAGDVAQGLPAMLLMLAAGIPLYVCATASTPIAAALMAKGLEPGAALVFLLAGPATNVATMSVVRGLLGGRALAVYVAAIAGCALLAGAAVQGLYGALDLDPRAFAGVAEHEHLGVVAQVGGILLAALLVVHLAARLRSLRKA